MTHKNDDGAFVGGAEATRMIMRGLVGLARIMVRPPSVR